MYVLYILVEYMDCTPHLPPHPPHFFSLFFFEHLSEREAKHLAQTESLWSITWGEKYCFWPPPPPKKNTLNILIPLYYINHSLHPTTTNLPPKPSRDLFGPNQKEAPTHVLQSWKSVKKVNLGYICGGQVITIGPTPIGRSPLFYFVPGFCYIHVVFFSRLII